MDLNGKINPDETRAIVSAVRRIHEDGSILAQARENLGLALDRLHLTGNARLVVAPLLAAALAVATSPGLQYQMWT